MRYATVDQLRQPTRLLHRHGNLLIRRVTVWYLRLVSLKGLKERFGASVIRYPVGHQADHARLSLQASYRLFDLDTEEAAELLSDTISLNDAS